MINQYLETSMLLFVSLVEGTLLLIVNNKILIKFEPDQWVLDTQLSHLNVLYSGVLTCYDIGKRNNKSLHSKNE